MHAPAERARHFVRNLSLARKIIVVIMGVSSTALLLACLALVAYDSTTARTTLTRDIGMLADVVGATSTAAVSFSDAKAATESLSAVAVNQNVRMATILRNGAVFARFDRERDTQNQSIVTRIDPSLVRSPRAVFSLWHVRLGERVTEGDRVAEVLIPGATVDVHAPASGTSTESRGTSPTTRVIWPCPVRSSASTTSPGSIRAIVPSPTSISALPDSVMEYCRRGAQCQCST